MNNIQDVISVIIPVYKVEKWLDQCVSSVVNQTYKNLEIILVDDGSPDQCPRMCDEWSTKDHRIRVVHKENGGLSEARNTGLDICMGEWITFVDSDDWLHHQALEKMLDVAKRENVRLVTGSYQLVGEDEYVTDEDILQLDYERACREQMLQSLYKMGKSQTIICAKLYHRSLWAKERFPVGKINEDEFTTYKLIYAADELIVTTTDIYYYRMRQGSIMSDQNRMENFDLFEALWERQDFFEDHKLDTLAKVNVNCILGTLLDRAVIIKRNGKDLSYIRGELDKIKYYKGIIAPRNYMKWFAFSISPWLYAKLIGLWRHLWIIN